jgi:hypothetical protein
MNTTRNVYVLHSALASDAVADVLRRSIDEKHWTIFSLSSFRGNRPLLGTIGVNTFEIQKRRISRIDFAGHLFGRFTPERGGTRVEAFFEALRWARYFMRFWLWGAVLIGVPLFVQTLMDVLRGDHSEGNWVGLIVPPALILYGILHLEFPFD